MTDLKPIAAELREKAVELGKFVAYPIHATLVVDLNTIADALDAAAGEMEETLRERGFESFDHAWSGVELAAENARLKAELEAAAGEMAADKRLSGEVIDMLTEENARHGGTLLEQAAENARLTARVAELEAAIAAIPMTAEELVRWCTENIASPTDALLLKAAERFPCPEEFWTDDAHEGGTP